MSDSETSAADLAFESGETHGRETEREIVKDEVLALFGAYIDGLSSGSGLDDSHIRVAVIHLQQLRNKVVSEI